MRSYHPAKFAKIWISLLIFKFSQILLGNKNATYLCSKIISTLLDSFFLKVEEKWKLLAYKKYPRILWDFYRNGRQLGLFIQISCSFSAYNIMNLEIIYIDMIFVISIFFTNFCTYYTNSTTTSFYSYTQEVYIHLYNFEWNISVRLEKPFP